MTTSEFSNEFDVLYNNIMSNQAPGLDEYEKSVFLTKAQNEILKNYFNPKGNKYQEGFDGNRKRQVDFSNITKTASVLNLLEERASGVLTSLEEVGYATTTIPTDFAKYDDRGVVFEFPNDVFIPVNESILNLGLDVTLRFSGPVDNSKSETRPLPIVPIKYDAYDTIQNKPYRYPLKRQAWRLIHSEGTSSYIEVILPSRYPNTMSILQAGGVANRIQNGLYNYKIRYIRKPLPIILEGLLDDLSIDGYRGRDSEGTLIEAGNTTQVTSGVKCELDPELHPEILQRAVELAKAAYVGDINSQVQMGQRAE